MLAFIANKLTYAGTSCINRRVVGAAIRCRVDSPRDREITSSAVIRADPRLDVTIFVLDRAQLWAHKTP